MSRKIEYVFGWVDFQIDDWDDVDICGMANKRQADKAIKLELDGQNNNAGDENLAWVRKYIWVDGDLWSDDDYWLNPAIVSEGNGGYQ